MDLRQIKELMAAMERTGTKRLKIKEENYELNLERHDDKFSAELGTIPDYLKAAENREDRIFSKQEMPFFKATGSSQPPSTIRGGHENETGEVIKQKKGEVIKSPMVGTYYLAPSPDDPPFVKVGDLIQSDSVVCIIEAMKVMNEIKAGVKGRIIEILVENGQPVEFGTPLLRIET